MARKISSKPVKRTTRRIPPVPGYQGRLSTRKDNINWSVASDNTKEGRALRAAGREALGGSYAGTSKDLRKRKK